jgi:uncharacterized YceG family protein
VPGRSPEERERARREREARRAARARGAKSDGVSLASLEERLRRVPRPGRDGAGGRRPRLPRTRIATVAALVGGLLVIWFLVSLFQPFHGDGDGEVRVVVPRGAGVGDIAELLEEKGVIDSPFFFQLRATLGGERGDLKPGPHTLERDMSYGDALEELTTDPSKKTVTVTIPEGKSRREAATFVSAAGFSGDYVKATERSRELDPRDYGAPRGAELEGFLFPATYELRGDATVEALVRRQLEAFRENFGTVSLRAAKRKSLSAYDVLIIASLIDREVAVPRERRLVASVIYNRLGQGVPLGIDATTRYETNNWTEPLEQSELERDTPYNTRVNRGLPPGPIGNPGVASMKAAASPASTGYLYYVQKVCGGGAHEFTESFAEFQRLANAYERKRQELGRAPTEC